ncbi:PepSY-associated TM helix domain-containing protein [Sagittula salina]|uniref:PepSY domain-containing protein n=1 Tax=Sagittula salina TaxID=2820268 RepID=A0A940MKU2_9RHOB|nr:PepSY-associated TM helix domain-containing protein [Sagittula salina]MBP0481605.1 PepSY domain-containing protein [Sagittula salina]
MLRNVIFWAHLLAGLTAGLVVFVLAVTGALLAFEGQIEDWVRARAIEAPRDAAPLSVEVLLEATGAQPGQVLTLPRGVGGLVTLSQGRLASVIDPWSGAVVEGAGAGVAEFFLAVEGVHRWLAPGGRSDPGREVVGAANLLFLWLVVSGLYLWLPKAWRWTVLKTKLFFRRGLPTAQARDYNWHHVFGIWALVPLFVIVLTGVVMSYSWANALLYASVGEVVPQRGPPANAPAEGRNGTGGGQGVQRGASNIPNALARQPLSGTPLSYAELIAVAEETRPNWKRAQIAVPESGAGVVALTLDAGNGQQPAAKTRLVMDRATGAVIRTETGATGTVGARLRLWARFAHTGQYYGLVGQAVAGLASLAAAVLVYTGMALGLRRLWRMARPRRTA